MAAEISLEHETKTSAKWSLAGIMGRVCFGVFLSGLRIDVFGGWGYKDGGTLTG